MREFRIIAVLVLSATVVVLGFFLWSLIPSSAGIMDAQVVHRITRLCDFQRTCKVRLRDLFEGDWDTFYEFQSGVPQS